MEPARKGMAGLGKSPRVLRAGALRVRAGCLEPDLAQRCSALCDRSLGRISRSLLEDFGGLILLHWSRAWLQGNVQVLKIFA